MPRSIYTTSGGGGSGGSVEVAIDLLGKADSSTVDALTTRVNTAETNINDLTTIVGGKADASAVATLETTVNGKADTSTVNALTTTVNGKADTSTVDALTTTVNGKADTSTVNTLTTTVNGKASQADLDALETTVAGLGGGGSTSLSYVQVALTTNSPQQYSGNYVQPQYNQTIQSSDNIFTVESTRHKIHVPAGTYLIQMNLVYNLDSVGSGSTADSVGVAMRIAGGTKIYAVNSNEGHDDYGHVFASKLMTFTASSTKLEFYYVASNIAFREMAYPPNSTCWSQIIKIG